MWAWSGSFQQNLVARALSEYCITSSLASRPRGRHAVSAPQLRVLIFLVFLLTSVYLGLCIAYGCLGLSFEFLHLRLYYALKDLPTNLQKNMANINVFSIELP